MFVRLLICMMLYKNIVLVVRTKLISLHKAALCVGAGTAESMYSDVVKLVAPAVGSPPPVPPPPSRVKAPPVGGARVFPDGALGVRMNAKL